MTKDEEDILLRIEEIKEKIVPLIVPLHDLYMKFKNFKGKFCDVFLTIYSEVLIELFISQRLEIRMTDLERISLLSGHNWCISLSEKNDNVLKSEFSWDYGVCNTSDPTIVNHSKIINIPLAFEKYGEYDTVTGEWYYNDYTFDDADAMIMQLSTIYSANFYSSEVLHAMVDLIKYLNTLVPENYILQFDNLFRLLKSEDIVTVKEELNLASGSFSC